LSSTLLICRIVGVSSRPRRVEGIAVIVGQWPSIPQPVDHVRVTNEMTTKDNSLGLTILNCTLRIGIVETSSSEHRGSVQESLEGFEGEVVSDILVRNTFCLSNSEELLLLLFTVHDQLRARLDEVHVCESLPADLLNDVAIVLVNVGGISALKKAERGETDSNAIGPNGSDDPVDHFKDNATAVLGAATVSVGAEVDVVRDELIKEVTVCGVLCSENVSACVSVVSGKSLAYDFNTVEAGSDCTLGGVGVVGYCVLNLLNGHFPGSDTVLWPLWSEENLEV